MIVEDKAMNVAEMSDGLSAGKFRIKESAKAFSILSSSLYANPIRAIVRELGCNARDSHVEAKQDKPFYLHLPTVMEPEFYIRDYGVGLSHDSVLNLYTTYFESTKTNSNDFVGALGLGSKSPFSYTENFTVTAIKDGIRGVYTAFINDEGVPSIVRLMSEETVDEPGVEVRFAVKQSDHPLFEGEACNVFGFFDQLPESNKKIPKHAFSTSFGAETVTYRNARRYGIIMGGIYYPVEVKERFPEFAELETGYSSVNIVTHAGIGEIEIQPSREGLTYTKTTNEFIRRKLTELFANIDKEIDTMCAKSNTDWDRYVELSTNKINHRDGVIANRVKSRLTKIVAPHASNMTKLIDAHYLAFSYTNYGYTTAAGSQRTLGKHDSIKPEANRIIVLNDTKHSRQRIYDTVRRMNKTFIMISKIKSDPATSELTDKELSSLFMGTPIVRASTLGIIVVPKVVVNDAHYVLTNVTSRGYYSRDKKKFERCTDPTSAKYFIRFEDALYTKYDPTSLYEMFGPSIIGVAKTSKFNTKGLIDIETHLDTLERTYLSLTVNDINLSSKLVETVMQNMSSIEDSELIKICSRPKITNETERILAFLKRYRSFVPKAIPILDERRLRLYSSVMDSVSYVSLSKEVLVDLINSIFKHQ